MVYRKGRMDFAWIRRRAKQIGRTELLTGSLILFGLVLLLVEGHLLRKSRYEAFLVKELQDDRQDFSTFLSAQQQGAKAQKNLAGTGIVICAGGNQLLINTFVSIKVLRDTLKSSLPVEIYHVGPKDVGPATRTIFGEIAKVVFIDLKQATLPKGHRQPRKWKAYMWKIYSLYLTKFEKVLLLDADSQPLRDPAELFGSAQFKEHGNLFWSDFWGPHTSEAPKEEVYSWLGLQAPWKTRQWSCGESGQLLIDKSMHADVIEWLWFLNSHAELLYQHMLGDKDTFEMAFMLANKHYLYQRIPVHPGIPLSGPKAPVHHQKWFTEQFKFQHEKTRYLRLGMLQYGPDLLPSFLHRTERTKFANWKNGYDLETMKPQFFLPSFGPNVTIWEKKLMWNAHSLPAGMIDLKGEHCILNPEQTAVLQASAGHFIPSSTDGQSCWYEHGSVAKQPIFPVTALDDFVMLPIWKSISAYEEIADRLRARIRLKASP